MDQFSHDLTLALEETSLVDRARWGGQRRRTCSTGNLPCAPQPTEDSSSTDNAQKAVNPKTNIDGLDTHNVVLPSDSEDDKDELLMRLPCKLGTSAIRFGALESDSLNETFSPARFFKPNARRKRKLKRMSVEYDLGAAGVAQGDEELAPFGGNCTMRKRGLKQDSSSGGGRSNLFFCGKRKRSNRDRYHEYDVKFHSSSVPRHNYLDEYSMRPRSYSSNATKPQSDCLLPLNKGLVSKIERISQQQQKTSPSTSSATVTSINATTEPLAPPHTSDADADDDDDEDTNACSAAAIGSTSQLTAAASSRIFSSAEKCLQDQNFQAHRQKSGGHRHSWRRSQLQQQLQFAVDQHPMDCEELYDFLSSSSLSSSESEDNANATNDTGREGDDELTDWPGNEASSCLAENRKLTKKQNLTLPAQLTGPFLAEEDTLMSVSLMGATVGGRSSGDSISGGWATAFATGGDKLTAEAPPRFQVSDPIAIAARSTPFSGGDGSGQHTQHNIPLKQIESEMSGETSNPFLASPPCQPNEVREIRAGCRRIKGERPGFSIKTSVNERLARFLQDPRQSQMRLPDIEIYEHDSLTSLAGLYSLNMSLDNGCAVLSKTSNTTQSVNIDQQGLQGRLLFSDFKRRCYDGKSTTALPNE